MARLLVCGDINVDIILGGMESAPQIDREVLCASYEVTIGSSGAIAACNYASLGGNVTFAGLAGSDSHGDFMIDGMNEFGIQTDLVRRTSEEKTGVTVNLIHGTNRTQVTYPGTIPVFAGKWLDQEVLTPFDHIHFAGPYLQTQFRPRISELLKLSLELGLSTSLDPQWDVSERWEGMKEWLPLLTYLFLNEDEALSFTGCENAREALRQLQEQTEFPLLKLGSAGALYWEEGPRAVPGFSVNVTDTTGAGDAFDAAFLYSQLELNVAAREAVVYANATAALSCCAAGGVNARSHHEEVLAFLQENSPSDSLASS